ncbi:MAG: ABC transporter ATP-binding protein [Candidatus Omnitrophota bacterium]|nr:ABC transporter ATP-binding protein [Candidatus Omnitrophota bacterium]
MNEFLLEVENLNTSFFTDAGEVRAVRGVSFNLEKGKTLGLVGESGCGKTVTALSIMRLLAANAKIIKGNILYKGKELTALSEEQMRQFRGSQIAMVFQEPMTALNPVFSIGEQIAEAIELHQGVSKKEAIGKVIEVLGQVGIPSPDKRMKDYPHQLSTGMRQRVLIAMAISCNPSILIADEPTTALDVTIQAQILELISSLQKKTGIAMILITHDLGIVAEVVDEVAVMYSGRIVERAQTTTLFEKPLHPYTVGLLDSIPVVENYEKKPLRAIKGSVPNLLHLPKGCSFSDRCPKAFSKCRESEPELIEVEKGHWVACYLYTDEHR